MTAKKAAKKRATPAPRQSPQSKDAILAAALKAFAHDGFAGASLPKIAKQAGVASPLIHYYFGTKDNLWRETVDYSLGRLLRETSAIRDATRALPPLDRLRVLLQAFTTFAANWPDHFAMIMAEAGSESDRFAWVQEEYIGALLKDVMSILAEAMDKDQIKSVSVDQLAYILFGGMLLYFTVNPAFPKGKDRDQLAHEYTDLVFSMLTGGLAKSEPRRRAVG